MQPGRDRLTVFCLAWGVALGVMSLTASALAQQMPARIRQMLPEIAGAIEDENVAEPALEGQPVPDRRQQTGAKQGQAETSQQAEEADRLVPALNVIVSALRDLKAEEDTEDRDRQHQREIADLKAQQDMAFWAKLMFWATFATVVVTTVGVYLIWRTLLHTRTAADAAVATVNEVRKSTDAALRTAGAAIDANRLNREAFVAEQRAWIAIEDIQTISPLTWSKEEGRISIRFQFNNIGRTPAKEIRFNAEIVVDTMLLQDGIYAEFAMRTRRRPFDRWHMALPNQNMTIIRKISVPISDIAAWCERSFGDVAFEEIWAPLTLIGCVDYRLLIANERHQTGFVISIRRISDVSEDDAIGPASGDIPADHLRLDWTLRGGMFAD